MKITQTKWVAWLPVLSVFVLPFGRIVEGLVVLMALVGAYDLIKNHQGIRQSAGLKLFTLFFLCFWIPALFSAVDAVNLKKSISTVIEMWRFYFAGLFLIARLNNDSLHRLAGCGIALVILFWSVDGWIQAFFGKDLLGLDSYSSNRVSGIFAESPRLGLMLIPFLGGAVAAVKERFGLGMAFGLLLVLASTIFISGDRSSWVSLVAMALFFIVFFRPGNMGLKRRQMMIMVFALFLAAGAIVSTSQFQSRMETVIIGFQGDYESINEASSLRLPIWEIAVNMFSDHWINGVGVRSFRYIYPEYARDDDPFVDKSLAKEKRTGAYHTHQIVLEFMAETGVIGVLGYLAGLWMLFVKWRPLARRQDSTLARGYLLSLMGLLFPFNSHLSFYSSDFAQVFWLVAALCVSALNVRPDKSHNL